MLSNIASIIMTRMTLDLDSPILEEIGRLQREEGLSMGAKRYHV